MLKTKGYSIRRVCNGSYLTVARRSSAVSGPEKWKESGPRRARRIAGIPLDKERAFNLWRTAAQHRGWEKLAEPCAAAFFAFRPRLGRALINVSET